MDLGLRCWDGDGNNIFDSTSRTSMFIGTFRTNRQPGSFHDDKLYAGEPFAVPVWYSDDFHDEDDRNHGYKSSGNIPDLELDGSNGFKWNYRDSYLARGVNCDVVFAYGVIPR